MARLTASQGTSARREADETRAGAETVGLRVPLSPLWGAPKGLRSVASGGGQVGREHRVPVRADQAGWGRWLTPTIGRGGPGQNHFSCRQTRVDASAVRPVRSASRLGVVRGALELD